MCANDPFRNPALLPLLPEQAAPAQGREALKAHPRGFLSEYLEGRAPQTRAPCRHARSIDSEIETLKAEKRARASSTSVKD